MKMELRCSCGKKAKTSFSQLLTEQSIVWSFASLVPLRNKEARPNSVFRDSSLEDAFVHLSLIGLSINFYYKKR